MPCPATPCYVLLLPTAMLALWLWDGYLWRRKRLFFDQYLWQQVQRFLGTDRR
jgi:hypothetical protein